MNLPLISLSLECSTLSCLPLKRSVKREAYGGVSSISGSCQYCGVEVELGLELHKGKKICPMCHCCLHLDHAGARNAGTMIYVSEKSLSQAQINILCFLLFMAKKSKEEGSEKFSSEADRIYGLFEAKSLALRSIITDGAAAGIDSRQVKKKDSPSEFPFDCASPLFFSQYIKSQEKDSIFLDGIRFLPSPRVLFPWINAWSESFLLRNPVSSWLNVLAKPSFIADIKADNGEL